MLYIEIMLSYRLLLFVCFEFCLVYVSRRSAVLASCISCLRVSCCQACVMCFFVQCV